ncbi:hypothetical protein [Pseudomonas sp.]|uniref:hypothetical protein n=1 Tax=Pseudomonas sp. TaxID=306 RepID=UPI0028AB7F79|nr:hypothetical protein [Pseudomonas sp.]
MEYQKDTSAMLEWRSRYLSQGILEEDQYDQALRCAESLKHAGVISAQEWIELVKAANVALLSVR